jgi:hypothetical protein
MRALVVYESMYGNTARIARGIGDGLAGAGVEVSVVAVDDAGTEVDVDLLVVGGPTHAHGMSSSSTRLTAQSDEENAFDDPTVGAGLRGWFHEIPAGDGRHAAAFDTRLQHAVLLTGSAAKGIAKRLSHHGFLVEHSPESFFVTKDNTLVDGEVERAEAWGATVARTLGAVR